MMLRLTKVIKYEIIWIRDAVLDAVGLASF